MRSIVARTSWFVQFRSLPNAAVRYLTYRREPQATRRMRLSDTSRGNTMEEDAAGRAGEGVPGTTCDQQSVQSGFSISRLPRRAVASGRLWAPLGFEGNS